MSKAIAAEKPSIESVGVAGHQPTRQSRKQRRKKLIDAPRQSKCLPKHRPASIITSLGCLVSSRLSRRSHPDCRAIEDPTFVKLERIPVMWKRSLHVGSNWHILAD